MNALFITATGTDVGKTYVCELLIRQMLALNRKVNAVKPIASGGSADAERLATALDAQPEALTLYQFKAPLSPHIAAQQEGKIIDLGTLAAWCGARIKNDSTLLIEGVGGVMTPLTEKQTVLDWIQKMKSPVVLVAGSYIGALSHTLSAVAALKTHGVTLTAVIVNQSSEEPMPLQETVATLQGFMDIPVVALPRHADFSTAPDLTFLCSH